MPFLVQPNKRFTLPRPALFNALSCTCSALLCSTLLYSNLLRARGITLSGLGLREAIGLDM